MNRKTASFVLVLLLGATSALLTGCYTVEGAGRDVAATGAGIASGAESTRQYTRERPGPGSTTQQR